MTEHCFIKDILQVALLMNNYKYYVNNTSTAAAIQCYSLESASVHRTVKLYDIVCYKILVKWLPAVYLQ